ncbi:MAG: chloride channel protein [Polyangiaceae bacterium]
MTAREDDEAPARAWNVPRVPIAPSIEATLTIIRAPSERATVDRRIVGLSGLVIALGLVAALVARLLTALIGLITNLAFHGRWSLSSVGPANNHLGLIVVAVPVVGGLVVGVMARYGSAAILGHGIPAAMDRGLSNEGPARVSFLKPLSGVIAIGTGGPFGAEGPIMATGSALGSLLGQVLRVSAQERKTLLAAGAAAGMSATFASPVGAVLLAIELRLFEYRLRSLVLVALASAAACGGRLAFVGSDSPFTMPTVSAPSSAAVAVYVGIGAAMGLASVLVARAVYAIEDAFNRLPMHWMWWPAIGGILVGVVGFYSPHTMGVGYDSIDRILRGDFAGSAVLVFCLLKLVSWCLSVGTCTSGGMIAPLFTIGGGLGSALGAAAIWALPSVGVDVRMAALVGMAALFAGASRTLLASVVFAVETTRQPTGLLPLLGACTMAYVVSAMLMQHAMMTEKVVCRPGARAVTDCDFLDQVRVGEVAATPVVVLRADDTLDQVRTWIAKHTDASVHQEFPVVDDDNRLVGVVTRRDLVEPGTTAATLRSAVKRPPAVVFEDSSLREAADRMVCEGVGRLAVVTRDDPPRVIGMLTRSNLVAAYAPHRDAKLGEPFQRLPPRGRRK